MLTVEDIKAALPDHLKNAATQGLADILNQLSGDPEAAAAIRETFLGHTKVLNEGKFKLEDYANATAYVSYKLMGYTNQEAYARTFPQRYQALVARGASSKDISAYVAIYNRGKLVNLVLEQALIPVWVINQDVFQKAVMTQLDIMQTAKSEMVRMQAANSLLTHIKPPEKKQIDLNITTPETSGMTELRQMLTMVAERQRQLIEQGATTREIAHQKISMGGTVAVTGDMIDVTPAGERGK